MKTKIELNSFNGKVDEKIYGQFIEHILTCIYGGIYDPQNSLADEAGIRCDVVEKVKDISPPILRFPGGTVTCVYHWEDAIGPVENRTWRMNRIWGGELDPAFGTAEFVQYCRRIGAEPMICVNMASGTAEEAANWVEYCNGTGNSYYAKLRRQHGYEEPFNVKYWCIGNESNAVADLGVHHDVKLYIRDAWEYIKFMKLTDRSIKTIIVGCADMEWNKTVLDALHPVTDYFSVHFYAGEMDKGLYGTFDGEKNLKKQISKVSALLEAYPEKVTDFDHWYRFEPRSEKIRIALDEWNVWDFVDDYTHGVLEIYNWRDALWVASVLNYLVSNPVFGIANMAQMVNVLAPIVSEEKGSWYQTIAYPLLLFRKTMVGERILTAFDSPVVEGGKAEDLEALSVSAVKNEDGTIRIAVVNRDLERGHEISLKGIGVDSGKEGQMISLTADGPRAVCSLENCCVHEKTQQITVDQIVLEAGSVNLITI